MYVAEPETYSIDSWHEMFPCIMSHPGVAERVREALLSDIGVERHFFHSIISDIYGVMSAMHSPFITLDVTLYLFSYEEHLGRTRPSPAMKESAGPCSICLEDLCGDQGSDATRLSCSHNFHNGCIVRWLCSANTTCPLCRCVLSC
ncbi:hypothetical protein MLD38_010231 [Melastoma candidum]|uniref:Uncharacterized protein n=1 Tax=Melastoma candidum TaxID=119954 RepID=A0ACB9QZB6_9MYRT|nr:hypothetical protein MLD38_010231 [Melastoma candidum]